MDLPVFHLDFLNNRMLIAIIAILHVVINHAMAVGGIPLVTYLEYKAYKEQDITRDQLAYRILKTFFMITTTIGAMTGVGIWFSTTLVNPYAIGSLLRVFFWTWFVEWLVFVTEVVLILWYYKTWKHHTSLTLDNAEARADKKRHIKKGIALSIASWATMALIVSILAFMMDPGAWQSDKTLLSGMFNPVYLPQLAFRTPLAMAMAGTFALLVAYFVGKNFDQQGSINGISAQTKTIKSAAGWSLVWLPFVALGGLWYAGVVPDAMKNNLPVAMLTQMLAGWAKTAQISAAAIAAGVAVLMAIAYIFPKRFPAWAVVLPFVLSIGLLGTFERVREFIRKPYAINNYLYANGFRQEDYPILQRDGVLAHATYTTVRDAADPKTIREAGKQVFILTCTRCHTTDGINGIRTILGNMYGENKPWDRDAISAYIGGMHNTRPFMPPFPSNAAEKDALSYYLTTLQKQHDSFEGAQSIGVTSPPFLEPIMTPLHEQILSFY